MVENMKPVDFCPKCENIEGDPIQAINCKPVKWSCPECGTKWTEEGIPTEDEEKSPTYL